MYLYALVILFPIVSYILFVFFFFLLILFKSIFYMRFVYVSVCVFLWILF